MYSLARARFRPLRGILKALAVVDYDSFKLLKAIGRAKSTFMVDHDFIGQLARPKHMF